MKNPYYDLITRSLLKVVIQLLKSQLSCYYMYKTFKSKTDGTDNKNFLQYLHYYEVISHYVMCAGDNRGNITVYRK